MTGIDLRCCCLKFIVISGIVMNLMFKICTIFYCTAIFISCVESDDKNKTDGDFQVDYENLADDVVEPSDGPAEEEDFEIDDVVEVENDGSTDTDQTADEGIDADQVEPDFFVKVSVSQNPAITLTAIVEVETVRESQVFVRFNKPNKEKKETSKTIKQFNHRLIVAGMTAESIYEFEIVALENGTENIFKSSFTTGKLPEKMPEYRFEILQPEKITEGITFIPSNSSNSGNPEFIGFDENSDIVWYLPASVFSTTHQSTQIITMLDDGNLMLYNGIETVIANIGGEVIQSIQNIELGVDIHHDIKRMENGSFIALSKERKESTVEWSENPIMLISDLIVIINDSKKIEWSWSTFDYLDTNYFPSELSKTVIGENIYDWTHANSIDLKGEETLVSLRHQHQAINIDRSSGELLWKLGENGDFVLKNIDRQNGIDWFYGPHNATWTSDNEILIFDNGNDRPAGSSIVNSRAVLYKIDEIKMEAEQVWQFPLDYFYTKFGSAQRIKAGNYLVCGGGVPVLNESGSSATVSQICEVSNDNPGQIISKIELIREFAYRAVKYPSMYSNK